MGEGVDYVASCERCAALKEYRTLFRIQLLLFSLTDGIRIHVTLLKEPSPSLCNNPRRRNTHAFSYVARYL